MAEQLITWFVKYWFEAILGLVSLGMTYLCKKFHSLYKAEKNHQKTEEQKAFYKGLQDTIMSASALSRQEESKLREEIALIKEGVLSIQGRNFKNECREYLQPETQFTLEQFESLQEEHDIYNRLGGNHDGDVLYALVEKKASNILTDDK